MKFIEIRPEILTESKVMLPPSFKVCGTCMKWAGQRSINSTRTLSEFDPAHRGQCVGGGFNFAQVTGQTTCSEWQVWPVLK